ncbi:MAG: inositol monophosphatase family protein, partial [Acidimicrobiales bacterium]
VWAFASRVRPERRAPGGPVPAFPAGGPGDDSRLLRLLHQTADALVGALDRLDDWSAPGERPGQYRCDLVADAVVVECLCAAGLEVWSEESGRQGAAGELLAVVDPIDGSTNAAARLPYYSTSLALLDEAGPRVALVVNLACGSRYEAVRGGGARRDGTPLRTSATRSLRDAVVALNGWAPGHLGWRQYRAMGAASLELCAVAEGALDGYLDLSDSGLAPWDYLGALLVCAEAGAAFCDADGGELVALGGADRRRVVAAAGGELLDELVGARAGLVRASGARPKMG